MMQPITKSFLPVNDCVVFRDWPCERCRGPRTVYEPRYVQGVARGADSDYGCDVGPVMVAVCRCLEGKC